MLEIRRNSAPRTRSHRRLNVHLSLTSGWVHLAWTHAGFRRCASFIGSVLIVSIRPLSSSGSLRRAINYALFYSRSSFSVLVFQSRVSRFSFLVFSSSFRFVVFQFRVPRSQFDTTSLLLQLIYTFFSPFSLSSVGSSSSCLSSVPRRFDVHLLLISRMGLRGP